MTEFQSTVCQKYQIQNEGKDKADELVTHNISETSALTSLVESTMPNQQSALKKRGGSLQVLAKNGRISFQIGTDRASYDHGISSWNSFIVTVYCINQ